jgi:hypothetical protein
VDQPAALLKEAAALAVRAAALLEEGRVEEASDAQRQADLLMKRARRRMVTAAPARGPVSPPGREIAISALAELGVPASPRLIASYTAARFGVDVRSSAFSSLRRDEHRAWTSTRASRTVYIVPGLEARRFTALRGVLTLSDWDLWRRLLGPRSPRVDHLRATIAVAEHLAWLKENGADARTAQGMQRLLDELARTLPGVGDNEWTIGASRARELAEAELSLLEQADRELRISAAARAMQQLDERELVWGAEPLHAVPAVGE